MMEGFYLLKKWSIAQIACYNPNFVIDNKTLLQETVQLQRKLVAELINKGASVNREDASSQTALSVALRSQQQDLAAPATHHYS